MTQEAIKPKPTPAIKYLQAQYRGLDALRTAILITKDKTLITRMPIRYDRSFYMDIFNTFIVFCEPPADRNEYDRYTILARCMVPHLGAPIATGLLTHEAARLINCSPVFKEFPVTDQLIRVRDQNEAQMITDFINQLLKPETA